MPFIMRTNPIYTLVAYTTILPLIGLNETLPHITAIVAIEVVLEPIVLIRITSVSRISGVVVNAWRGAGEGILIGALLHLAYLEAAFLFTGWLGPSNAGVQVAALGAVLVCLSPVCSSVVAPSFGDPFYTDVGMLARTLVLFTNFYAALFASPRQTTKTSTINAIQKNNERKDAEFHCPLFVHLVVRFVL